VRQETAELWFAERLVVALSSQVRNDSPASAISKARQGQVVGVLQRVDQGLTVILETLVSGMTTAA